MRCLNLIGLVMLFLLGLPITMVQAVEVKQFVSDKGIEVWLVQDHTNPMLSMRFSFSGGAQVENISGLASMVASLLDEGAGSYDSQAFQGDLSDRSIALSFQADSDHFRGTLKTLTDEQDKAFELLHLSMTEPRFDAEPIERIRAQIQAILAREDADSDALAIKEWKSKFYGSHPYGRPIKGTKESLNSITADDLRTYAKNWLSRDNLKISVVGDITPEKLGLLLDKTFADLPKKSPEFSPVDFQSVAQGGVVVIPLDQPQSVAFFGHKGPKRNDPDWYGAYVLNYILGGGGFSSRLMIEVREKRGLAYSTYSYLMPSDHAGVWIGGVSTENNRFDESFAVIKDEWKKMAEKGVTDQELTDAKTYLTGSFPLRLDSTGAIAGLLLSMSENDLGSDFLNRRNDFIEAVTKEDIQRIAQKWLDPDSLLWVVVGKPNLDPKLVTKQQDRP